MTGSATGGFSFRNSWLLFSIAILLYTISNYQFVSLFLNCNRIAEFLEVKASYISSETLEVGLFSISNPFSFRKSTMVEVPTFNSFAILTKRFDMYCFLFYQSILSFISHRQTQIRELSIIRINRFFFQGLSFLISSSLLKSNTLLAVSHPMDFSMHLSPTLQFHQLEFIQIDIFQSRVIIFSVYIDLQVLLRRLANLILDYHLYR